MRIDESVESGQNRGSDNCPIELLRLKSAILPLEESKATMAKRIDVAGYPKKTKNRKAIELKVENPRSS